MKLQIVQLGEIKPVQTKFGPKEKRLIKTKEYGENLISVWVNPEVKNWQVGQEVEGEVKSREWQGKTYYDLVLPKKAFNNEKIDKIYDLMLVMVEEHKTLKEYLVAKLGIVEPKKNDYPVNDLDMPTF